MAPHSKELIAIIASNCSFSNGKEERSPFIKDKSGPSPRSFPFESSLLINPLQLLYSPRDLIYMYRIHHHNQRQAPWLLSSRIVQKWNNRTPTPTIPHLLTILVPKFCTTIPFFSADSCQLNFVMQSPTFTLYHSFHSTSFSKIPVLSSLGNVHANEGIFILQFCFTWV